MNIKIILHTAAARESRETVLQLDTGRVRKQEEKMWWGGDRRSREDEEGQQNEKEIQYGEDITKKSLNTPNPLSW